MSDRTTGRTFRTERDKKMNIQNSVSLGQAPQPDVRAVNTAPRPAVQAPVQEKPEPSLQQVQQAVQAINRVLQTSSSSLEFSVDQSTHRTIVRVVDTESGELIRQIPSDAVLAIAESIGELQKGLLLRQQA
jgi:flagellar protein FlaG